MNIIMAIQISTWLPILFFALPVLTLALAVRGSWIVAQEIAEEYGWHVRSHGRHLATSGGRHAA